MGIGFLFRRDMLAWNHEVSLNLEPRKVTEPRPKIVIVGIGDDGLAGLTQAARAVLTRADVILAPASLVGELGGFSGKVIPQAAEMREVLGQLDSLQAAKSPVLVTGGDPLFYGIARFLCDRMGKDRFEVLPHVSSMQLAFARIKENWDDAYFANLESRPLESIIDRIRVAEKVGLFSSDRSPPAAIAGALLERGIDHFRAYVCENLGSPDERVTQGELDEIRSLAFDPLNVMILVRKPNRPDRAGSSGRYRLFGNPDEAFAQSRPKRGLITQAEVRSIALAQMDIRPASVVWDIGAGSGSVAIEAAQLAHAGTVYAIEPEPEDLALIQANAETFAAPNVRAIAGRAPEALADLPTPDAVFVGGTGRQIGDVLIAAYHHLAAGGKLVVNVATIDGLASAVETLKRLAGKVDVWNVAVARGVEQFDRFRFEAVHPTFLLAATKQADAGD